MKYDMTTPLLEKRAKRKARIEAEHLHTAQIDLANRQRAGKRVFALLNPGDYQALEEVREYAKANDFYLDAVWSPDVMDEAMRIIEEGEHVDIAILANGSDLSKRDLLSLSLSCKIGNVAIHVLKPVNFARRVLIGIGTL